ncbi:MAG: PQQ-dependent sugar dehydrogenase [Adhaeribacter sp.]
MKKIKFLLGLLALGIVYLAYASKNEKLALPVTGAAASWQTGKMQPAKYRQATSKEAPDSSRLSYQALASGLNEPMGMAILPNLDVVVIERKGGVKYFNNSTQELAQIAQFNVFSGIEDGLLGVAVDPAFKKNNWVYFYYAVAGDQNINHLVRFELKNQELNQTSKKILLEVPTQRTYCCHSAGYITFGPDGLLYLSIGDNTNAEEIEGHNPIDERPGRQLSDDQGTTANSNDLRGKILRIKPEANGTYSIPEGNLFPKDGSLGKPEIFAMGLRNPFRVAVDAKTQYVYWGDVGPDSEVKASEGKLSYDEINQARRPGFFGYPYFLGANEVFPDYDFATKKEGPGKDPKRPINDSPNNTGVKELPPAQPAFIWYGKGPSAKWPLLGKGGASAMAGPVYYSDLYPNAPYKLPAYYNGKLFIYDWIRRWILAVSMDAAGNYVSMEPFLPQLKVVAPIDMQIAPDGAIYLLAYGTNWFAHNTDSGIIRVEYAEGNRKPVAAIKANKTIGAAPLTITLSASGSKDFDAGSKLSYEWKIGNKSLYGKDARYTFTKAGVYKVVLTVSDQQGGKGIATMPVKVGNSPPVVVIATKANRSFYWDNTVLDYQVKVTDAEDGNINPEKIKLAFNYLPFGKDLASLLSADNDGNIQNTATVKLYNSQDCKSCHTLETKSVGPALKEIAKRYKDQEGAAAMIARKIISGGSGNWGSYPMPPHANLTEKEAQEIANYILALEKRPEKLPLSNKIMLSEHIGKGTEGAYVLHAAYTDKGANGIEPLTTTSQLVLRNPLVQFEDYQEGNVNVVIGTLKTQYVTYIANITDGKFARFNGIDLNHIKSSRLRVREQGAGGKIELRQNTKDGPLLGAVEIAAGVVADSKTDWKEIQLPLTAKNIAGIHDLYFVFRNGQAKESLFHLDWMYFEQ